MLWKVSPESSSPVRTTAPELIVSAPGVSAWFQSDFGGVLNMDHNQRLEGLCGYRVKDYGLSHSGLSLVDRDGGVTLKAGEG